MKESELNVADAYPNDSARGIARLDPDVLRRIDLDPGDVIEIAGDKRAVARVWRADRKDWNTDTIRIDRYTRRNAGVEVGETVTVRKAITRSANKVVLSPLKSTSLEMAENASGMVKRLIIDRPIVEGELLPVMSQDNPFIRSSDEVISLVVVETEPGGVVTIDEDTELELREPNKGDRIEEESLEEPPRLELMDADLFVEARKVFVEGKVKNVSNDRLDEASVDVVFYKDSRKSVHLDTWSASTRKLASGKVWMFRVYYQGPNDITPEGFEIILNN